MNSSRGFSSLKAKFALVLFTIFALCFATFMCENSTFAHAYIINAYDTAAQNLIEISYYPYDETAQEQVEEKLDAYATLHEAEEVSESPYYTSAEAKYAKLIAQRTGLRDYFSASSEILNIVCYAQDNSRMQALRSDDAMTAYMDARGNLIRVYDTISIMNYVNSILADAKYSQLNSERIFYVEICYPPYLTGTFEYYEIPATGEPVERDFKSKLNGFDSTTMLITNNKKTQANETGYDVVVSLKDKIKYRWNDGSVDDKHYNFVILRKRISTETLNAITFANKTAYYNGTAHSVMISNLSPKLSVVRLIVNGEQRPLSGVFSATNPGTYIVTMRVRSDNNHYIYEQNGTRMDELELTSTLTIKPQQLTANSVIVEDTNGFDTSINFYVLSASPTERDDASRLLLQKNIIAENEQVCSMFQAFFVQNGQEVQPENDMNVRMLIPEALRGENFRLVHIHNVSENVNEISNVDYEIDGNFVVFTASSLSSFAFVSQIPPGVNVLSIISITAVCLALLILIGVFVLYLIWKNYDKKLVKSLVPMFKRMNKLFHGTVLNDVELVEEGKKLLKKANDRQRLIVEIQNVKKQELKPIAERLNERIKSSTKNAENIDKNKENKK